MTRGSERQATYVGRAGRTRKERVHYTGPDGAALSVEVFRAVDAVRDPDAAARLLETDPARALNTVHIHGEESPRPVEVPVVYHDPKQGIFALVLPPSARHRELTLRAELLLEIAADTEAAVPPYVRDFAVVYGAGGLRRYLETRADARHEEERRAHRETELSEREAELARRDAELQKRETQLAAREAELARAAEELERRASAPPPAAQSSRRPSTEPEAAVADEAEVTAAVPLSSLQGQEDDPTPKTADAEEITNPVPRLSAEELEEGSGLLEVEPEPVAEGDVVVADQVVGEESAPSTEKMPVVRDDGSTQVVGKQDAAIERWIVSREPTLELLDDRGRVRLAAKAEPKRLEDLLSDRLEVRVQLHRLPTYPLVTVSIGSSRAMEGEEGAPAPLVFQFDVADEAKRPILEALAEDFTFSLELFDVDYLPVRRRTVAASLRENVTYALSAADEHLDAIPAEERNANRAVLAYAAPDYDRFARRHPERKEFREDKLQALGTPAQVRRALAIARRFSAPANQEYLILQRGYPLALWQKRRRRVLERALDLGLWTGPTLAGVALSEGFAASRKVLVERMQRNFARTVADASVNDLDQEAVRDNWKELGEEATALGMEPVSPRSTPIHSAEEPIASGVIARTEEGGGEVSARPEAASRGAPAPRSLVADLDDKDRRLEAALQLSERAEVSALPAVFSAVERMTRGEAGRVLGSVTQFGGAAVPHLVEALGSRKGFIRQGAALALGVLGEERGVEAICDLLLHEPTEIWKEIARAVGEVGPGAVMSLVSRIGAAAEEKRERMAWALAHVANRGGRQPLETLAAGRDPVAAGVARHALELADLARNDDIAVRSEKAPRDQTVNRAFSRRFFEAMRSGERRPLTAGAGAELSGPAMVLDESDLIEANDLEEGPG